MRLERYISPEYLAKQKWLHKQPKGYGGRGDKWATVVSQLLQKYACSTMLDYGCGQATLAAALAKYERRGVLIHSYDPAIAARAYIPKILFDLVVCTDVLEHIERDKLPIVIDHLQKLTVKALFLVIATRPSNKWFEDGTNAHLIIEPRSWWLERIEHPSFRFVEPPRSPMSEASREVVLLMERQV